MQGPYMVWFTHKYVREKEGVHAGCRCVRPWALGVARSVTKAY